MTVFQVLSANVYTSKIWSARVIAGWLGFDDLRWGDGVMFVDVGYVERARERRLKTGETKNLAKRAATCGCAWLGRRLGNGALGASVLRSHQRRVGHSCGRCHASRIRELFLEASVARAGRSSATLGCSRTA